MRLDASGINAIVAWEAVRLFMYDDGGPGVGNATIGIGHLIHTGPIDGRASEAPFRFGISVDQAYALFRQDVASREEWVTRHVTRPMTPGEFNACVDFTYNCGVGAFLQIVGVVNARGNFCAAIAPWVLPAWAADALRRRRQAECAQYYGIAGPALPGVPPVEEDEVWHRHNEVANNAYWFQERHTFGAGERATLNLRVDLPRVMGFAPSAVDLDLYSDGDAAEIRDGDGRFAGLLDARRRNDQVRVVPVNGTIQIWVPRGPVTVKLGCVGYVD